MHDEVVYEPGTTGAETVHLDAGSLYIGQALDLRSRQWSYTLGAYSLSRVVRSAREVTCTLSALNQKELDQAESVFDADVQSGQPGLLTDREWSCRAFVVKSEPQEVRSDLVRVDLTVVLLDGVWRRKLQPQNFVSGVMLSGSTYLDIPFDLPIDLKPGIASQRVSNPSLTAMPWICHVFGPVVSPFFRIGGNLYQVDCEVPDNAYLTIDARSGSKSVVMTDQMGGCTDLFAKARRGRGLNGGEYLFQPIPAGDSEVTWPNTFGFDITIVQERSAPPWLT